MEKTTGRRARPPLGDEQLRELALRYVARFATTRARLRAYLARKVQERGWDGDRGPDFETLVGRLVELGYVDDSAFAVAKSRALVGRGFGERRVGDALRRAGVDEDDGREARDYARSEAAEAALSFARRRRIGPFGARPADPASREKAIAAMVRAGHRFALARALVDLPPGADVNADQLLA